MPDIPKIVHQRLAEKTADVVHPDANLLTGFLERSLSEGERTLVLEHLARCAECREIVTLALPQEAEAALGVATGPAAVSWWRWSMLRWGALAAGVVIVTAAVLVPKLGERQAAVQTSAMEQAISKESEPARADEADAKQKAAAGAPAREGARVPLALPPKPRAAENKAEIARDARKDVANEKYALRDGDLPVHEERSKSMDRLEATAEPSSRPQPVQEQVAVAGHDRAAAQTPVGQALGRTRSQVAPSSPQQGVLRRAPAAIPLTATLAKSASSARWSISAEGAVQRSLDGGRTWETTPIAEGTTFRAVSALGTDVWAGGAGGALYHSSDGGEHWSHVAVRTEKTALTGDILRIEFKNPASGAVLTSTGETWNTDNAGQTWQRR